MQLHLLRIRRSELAPFAWSFFYFFAILSSYYVLRPVRDEFGIRGVDKLPWFFTATFVTMLAVVPLYSAVVARFERRRIIPFVYRFFALHLIGFFFLVRSDATRAAAAPAFFVWLSVFNLFVVSVFWSFMADRFTGEQAKRLFGPIAAGGSAGAVCGSLLVPLLVGKLGQGGLLLVSAGLLEAAVQCMRRLAADAHDRGDDKIGGGLLAGLTEVVRSPYLLAIAVQLLLYTVASTFLYNEQARIVGRAIADSEDRTALLALIDLLGNLLAFLLQLLVAAPFMTRLGLAAALMLVPVLSGLGFAALAAAPGLWLLIGFQGLRRSSHFAIERPANNVLYTAVDREQKYKAKNVIDTVVYRGGDAVASWTFTGVLALGLGAAATSLAIVPLTFVGVGLARFLAREQRRRTA